MSENQKKTAPTATDPADVFQREVRLFIDQLQRQVDDLKKRVDFLYEELGI